MKTCLLAEWDDGEIGGLIDLSFVGDDHLPSGPVVGRRARSTSRGRGELTVMRGKQYQDGPDLPLTINGIAASELKVYADGVLSYPVPIRRRDPAEAAERMRAGYTSTGGCALPGPGWLRRRSSSAGSCARDGMRNRRSRERRSRTAGGFPIELANQGTGG